MEQKMNNARPSTKLSLPGILLRVALVVLCLTMLCVHLMGSLYGRYSSTAEGSDSARVAKFDVKVTGDVNNNISVQCTQMPGNSATYQITVKNDSEVAVKYDVIITLSKLVNGVKYTLDNREPVAALTTTYADVRQLAPNAPNANVHVLTFLVDWNQFTESATGASYSDSFTFDITIHVEQVN